MDVLASALVDTAEVGTSLVIVTSTIDAAIGMDCTYTAGLAGNQGRKGLA